MRVVTVKVTPKTFTRRKNVAYGCKGTKEVRRRKGACESLEGEKMLLSGLCGGTRSY